MNVHTLLHAHYEGTAEIGRWLKLHGHRVSETRFYDDANLPDPDEIDWLVVMGGPMGVYEETKYPWLKTEKKFVEEIIRDGKMVLGICLGSQIIADALGAKVYSHTEHEIGWFPVFAAGTQPSVEILGLGLTDTYVPFHWHGDTFEIPGGATHLATSDGCENQAFAFGRNVLGLQYHPEANRQSVELLLRHCGDELTRSRWVQSPEEIQAGISNIDMLHPALDRILSFFHRKLSTITEG